MIMEELGYIDIWKSNQDHESDRYNWYHPAGTGFRIDNIIFSLCSGASLHDVYGFLEYKIRESKISYHSL